MIPKKILLMLADIEDAIGAEIGVAQGETTLQLVSLDNVKRVYAIDPFLKYSSPPNGIKSGQGYNDRKIAHMIDNEQTFEDFYNICKNKFAAYKDRIILLRKFSNQAAKLINEKLDFVYIDGNHAYEYVYDDLEKYYKLVRPGGIIIGDDFSFTGGRIKHNNGGRISSKVDLACINFCKKKHIKFKVIEGNFVFIKPYASIQYENDYKFFSTENIKRILRNFKQFFLDTVDTIFK